MPARTAQETPFRQATAAFGEQLRSWRQRRRMSQLELAGEADISTRHLSYVEDTDGPTRAEKWYCGSP